MRKVHQFSLFFLFLLVFLFFVNGVFAFWSNDISIDLELGDDFYLLDYPANGVIIRIDWDDFVIHQDYFFNMTISDRTESGSGCNMYARLYWAPTSAYELYCEVGGDFWGTSIQTSDALFDTVGTHPTGEGTIYVYNTRTVIEGYTVLVVVLDMEDGNFSDEHYIVIATEGGSAGEVCLFRSIEIDGCADLADDTTVVDIISDYYFPTTDSDPDSVPAEFETVSIAFLDFLIPVVIVCLPAGLLVVFVGRDMRLILIGIVIGASLGYTFGYIDEWVLFLIALGVVAMFYREIR